MSASDQQLTALVTQHDEIVVLHIGGDIDATSESIFDAVVANVLSSQPAGLIVELSAVEFFGSVGLKVLAAAHHRIACFAVVADSPAIRKSIRVTGLDAMLLVYETVDNAVAAIRNCLESRHVSGKRFSLLASSAGCA